jgi:hypothetical protein
VSDSASREPQDLTFVDITHVLGDLRIFPEVRRPGGSPRPRRNPPGFANRSAKALPADALHQHLQVGLGMQVAFVPLPRYVVLR